MEVIWLIVVVVVVVVGLMVGVVVRFVEFGLATACRSPFVKDGMTFPCGRCPVCLYSRRQVWAHRLQLEAMCHEKSAFVTLTYTDESLPSCISGLPSLDPLHPQGWLKRLRSRVSPTRFRFYLVGEYGDNTHRPHYHCMLFGLPGCARDRTYRTGLSLEPIWVDCCDFCRLVGNTWSFGNVDVGQVTRDSCGYIAGYVMKKLTRFDDPRLNGRHPEFSRMSNRPGIGADFSWEFASSAFEFQLDKIMVDVPVALRNSGFQKPLGRYLRRKFREALGRAPGVPQEVIDSMAAELLPLRQAAFDSSTPFKDAVVSASAGKFANFEARQNLFRKGKSL